MGSIPNTDEKFLVWCGYQTQKRGALEMMKLYVNQLNVESHMLHEQQLANYERQKKEQKELIIEATNFADAEPLGTMAPSGNDGTAMNISSPKPQNISFPNPQNISSPK